MASYAKKSNPLEFLFSRTAATASQTEALRKRHISAGGQQGLTRSIRGQANTAGY